MENRVLFDGVISAAFTRSTLPAAVSDQSAVHGTVTVTLTNTAGSRSRTRHRPGSC